MGSAIDIEEADFRDELETPFSLGRSELWGRETEPQDCERDLGVGRP
jgi:hypothetical protein